MIGGEKNPLHVVCGLSSEAVLIITAYFPDLAKWSNGFKIRKENI